MKNIYLSIFILLVLNLSSVAQHKIADLKIPEQVSNTLSKMCCDCEIKTAWSGFDLQSRYYNFSFLMDSAEYHVTIDSSGIWKRTYQEVELNSVPKKCMNLLNDEKLKYDKQFQQDMALNKNLPKYTFEEYEFRSVLIEFDRNFENEYYHFSISLPIDTNYEKPEEVRYLLGIKFIKISLDCELLNFEGKKTVRIDGEPIHGYVYFPNNSSTFSSNTTTMEYYNNKKNGLYIQYFKYPKELASVQYYVDDIARGPFIFYHKNGNIREIGYYENGQSIFVDEWTEDGTKFLKNIQYDSLQNVYTDNNSNNLDGKYLIKGGCYGFRGGFVFLNDGKIDSLKSNDGHFDITINYVDSSRNILTFYKNGNKRHLLKIKLNTINHSLKEYNRFPNLCEISELSDKSYNIFYHENTPNVSAKGYRQDGKNIGKWYYYNEDGTLKEEKEFK